MDINADFSSILLRSNQLPSAAPREGSGELLQNDKSFQNKLEKHLSDYEAGEGHLSMHISKDVNARKFQSADILARENPSAALLYSGYLTAGFGYSNQARFVQQVNVATKATSAIKAVA